MNQENDRSTEQDRTVSTMSEQQILLPSEDMPETESEPDVEIVGLRFRPAGKTYYFSPAGLQLKAGDSAIGETARGMELGVVTIANRMVRKSEIVSPLRSIVRKATAEDLSHQEESRRLETEALGICREKIKKHGLEMDLVSAEYTFDRSKLLFYFTAENRVDFRDLVKDLASVFRTRIELRQIGIRDEAKMMGGFGVCGRPFCCSTFLSDFAQVSIKMAKEQNFSLNSAKISGACGRLMCCLRYEHDAYEEALRCTPPNGSVVSTPAGIGTVVETRPLLGLVKVRLDDKNDTPKLYACTDVKILRGKGKTDSFSASDISDSGDALVSESEPPLKKEDKSDRQVGKRRSDKDRRKSLPSAAATLQAEDATTVDNSANRNRTRIRNRRGGKKNTSSSHPNGENTP